MRCSAAIFFVVVASAVVVVAVGDAVAVVDCLDRLTIDFSQERSNTLLRRPP